MYTPICCECFYQSKGQKLFELTCKMQISLPLNLVSIALKVPCGIIVLKFNLVRSFNFSLDNQTNKKLVSGGLNKDKKRTLYLLSLNIPHTSFKFKLGPPAKKHRGREGRTPPATNDLKVHPWLAPAASSETEKQLDGNIYH